VGNYIGNCSHVLDWNNFLSNLGQGITKSGDPWKWVNPLSDPNFPITPDMKSYVNSTVERLGHNFNYSSTLWHIYRPNEHFANEVVSALSTHLNITPTMTNAYRVEPGCNCPIHIDPQDKTDNKWNKLKRYTWQINQSSIGQVLIIGNHALHMLTPCDIYEWDSVDALHAATNCGSDTAYYFLMEGYLND